MQPSASLAVLATITLIVMWGFSGYLTDRYSWNSQTDRMEARRLLHSEVKVLKEELAKAREGTSQETE